MLAFRGGYIGGRFVAPKGRARWQLKRDPGDTSRIIGRWRSLPTLVEDAVGAAQRAYDDWAWRAPEKRFAFIQRLKTIISKRRDEIARCISSEMGKMLTEANAEIDAAIRKIDVTLKEAERLLATKQVKATGDYYSYHPRGVLAVIGPYNFPVQLPIANLIPALATGNTVVFKPSPITPFTGQLMAECFHTAGFPKGVFNMVPGGAKVGAALTQAADVAGILFVGSDKTGQKIRRQIEKSPGKICVLEMGGKNAALIMADAPLKKAITACAKSALLTTGQRCNGLSRVIIHEDRAQEFVKRLTMEVLGWTVGYFADEGSHMGPLASADAFRKFLYYQNQVKREGGTTILRGRSLILRRPGYYVAPGIHRMPWSGLYKERKGYRYDEIFGPDIAIYTFREMEEAIRIHNDCRYGLVASVFTKKKTVFEAMYRHLEVGILHWNRPTVGSSPYLPFGGVKASGNNFPAGILSPLFCTYPVAIQS